MDPRAKSVREVVWSARCCAPLLLGDEEGAGEGRTTGVVVSVRPASGGRVNKEAVPLHGRPPWL